MSDYQMRDIIIIAFMNERASDFELDKEAIIVPLDNRLLFLLFVREKKEIGSNQRGENEGSYQRADRLDLCPREERGDRSLSFRSSERVELSNF